MRPARSSRVVSALAILGLIFVSTFTILVLNSGSIPNPTIPFQVSNPNGNSGLTGVLVVQLYTNQDLKDILADPRNGYAGLGEKALTVTPANNSTSPTALITDSCCGGALQELPAGHYVVRFVDEVLDVKIPVQVFVGNLTKLKVFITEKAYPVVYSEVSGVAFSGGRPISTAFVELNSSAPAASVGRQVLLKVRQGVPGVGYISNATVMAQQPPRRGAQWLELGAQNAIDPVRATAIILSTWTYSNSTTFMPTPAVISPDE